MTPDNIEFLPPRDGEPHAFQLVYGLAGCCRALAVLTTHGEDDRDLLGNLASAADCLARLLVHRMGNVVPTAASDG